MIKNFDGLTHSYIFCSHQLISLWFSEQFDFLILTASTTIHRGKQRFDDLLGQIKHSTGATTTFSFRGWWSSSWLSWCRWTLQHLRDSVLRRCWSLEPAVWWILFLCLLLQLLVRWNLELQTLESCRQHCNIIIVALLLHLVIFIFLMVTLFLHRLFSGFELMVFFCWSLALFIVDFHGGPCHDE